MITADGRISGKSIKGGENEEDSYINNTCIAAFFVL